MSVVVRAETSKDLEAIREVICQAFGREDEARLVDALRDGGYARLSLVVEEGERVVGHILFSDLPIIAQGGTLHALALAPLAVLPTRQRQGMGSLLVREGLRVCADTGHRIVVVLGHPNYYPRFGFSASLAERLQAPYSGPAFMALELVPGALANVTGEVRYPPPFARAEEQQRRERSSLTIRPFAEADAEGVVALWTTVFAYPAPHNAPATVIRHKLALQRDLFFVAWLEGVLVGTVMGGYDGHRGWVYSLAVDPQARRRGIGTALMRHLEGELALRGCPKINLQVLASNAGTVEFYRKLGYSVEERISMGKLLAPPLTG
jgi:putative acetyltransferase